MRVTKPDPEPDNFNFFRPSPSPLESSDDVELTSDDEEQMTLEEINRQNDRFHVVIFIEFFFSGKMSFSNFSESKNSSSQSRHTTIANLAKTYRVRYLKTLKEIPGIPVNPVEKRSLESPTTIPSKRQCSSLSTSGSNPDNTLQRLRNRIRDEENKPFLFDDARPM